MTKHINLFNLVFRTVIGLVAASTLFAIWDYARCDGPNERCDGKAEAVKAGLLSLVPVFLAWVAPSNDGEPRSPTPLPPVDRLMASWEDRGATAPAPIPDFAARRPAASEPSPASPPGPDTTSGPEQP